jgi:hypothetical protein
MTIQREDMSETEEEERKEYIKRDPTVQGTVVTAPTEDVIVRREPEQLVVRREPVERVVVASPPPPVERRESIVRHTRTNTGALIAMAIGAVVLLGGVFIVLSQIHFLPWPLSMIAFLVVGLVFIGVGASLLGKQSTTSM